jgi:septal ring factor EnvC (AmiA/AmiB activator)
MDNGSNAMLMAQIKSLTESSAKTLDKISDVRVQVSEVSTKIDGLGTRVSKNEGSIEKQETKTWKMLIYMAASGVGGGAFGSKILEFLKG